MKSSAYPNFTSDSLFVKPVYNLPRWLDTMRAIYAKLHFGTPYKTAFEETTQNWNAPEKRDFATWMEYYQSGNQSKYKKAQFYVNDNIPGYLIPNVVPQKHHPIVSDFNQAAEAAQNTALLEQQKKDDKVHQRKLMEDQRKKIVGRLHAAIKHLTAYEGHLLAGDELDKLLSSMYTLLHQIQTVNKISLSNQLYTDLFIRQSNQLLNSGYNTSAAFLVKFAQNAGSKFDQAQGPLPIASQTGNGVAGSLENPTPSAESLSAPTPDVLQESSAPATPEKPNPLDELLENLNTGGLTDENFTQDENDTDDEVSLDDDLTVEAQMASDMPQAEPTAMPSTPITPVPQADMEVSLPEGSNEPDEPHKDIDAIINSALSSITIQDVIDRLDNSINVFKTRQLSRDITTADLMLNKLKMSSLFPELGEVQQKLFDTTSYVLTRLEKVNSQLRGTVEHTNVDLTPNITEDMLSPEVQRAKTQIEQNQQEDKERKETRRKMQDELDEVSLPETTSTMPQTSQMQPSVQTTPTLPPGEAISQIPTQLVP